MQANHNAYQIIPLGTGFTRGHFCVNLNTLCVTIEREPGWIFEPTKVRRLFAKQRISSLEAVSRSLIEHDLKRQDDTMDRMVAEYYTTKYLIDQGETILHIQSMAKGSGEHVRARGGCPHLGVHCHSPFHRLLAKARPDKRKQNKRYRDAHAQGLQPTDPSAPKRLRMPREHVMRCFEQHASEISAAVQLE